MKYPKKICKRNSKRLWTFGLISPWLGYILYLLILQLLLRHGICQMQWDFRNFQFYLRPIFLNKCHLRQIPCLLLLCEYFVQNWTTQHFFDITGYWVPSHFNSKKIFALEWEVLVECNWIISIFPKEFFPHSFARWQREMKEARGGEHRIYKGCGREWDPVWFGRFESCKLPP